MLKDIRIVARELFAVIAVMVVTVIFLPLTFEAHIHKLACLPSTLRLPDTLLQGDKVSDPAELMLDQKAK